MEDHPRCCRCHKNKERLPGRTLVFPFTEPNRFWNPDIFQVKMDNIACVDCMKELQNSFNDWWQSKSLKDSGQMVLSDDKILKQIRIRMEEYGMPEFKDNIPAMDILQVVKDGGYVRGQPARVPSVDGLLQELQLLKSYFEDRNEVVLHVNDIKWKVIDEAIKSLFEGQR